MKTIAEFDALLPNEDACKDLLVALRWPNGVECPRCGNKRVFALRARPYHWVCKSGAWSKDDETGEVKICPKNGGYRFSVIARTIFEDTKVPLTIWFKIGYLMLTAKKGISALQVHRVIFGEDSTHDYRTSWYVCMRLRAAMRGEVIPPLTGEVELDEVYLGGKNKNKHWNQIGPFEKGPHGKTVVIGAISRKGNVIAQAVEKMDTKTAEAFVRRVVGKGVKLVSTDEAPIYRNLRAFGLPHETVEHQRGEYVVGAAHTQSIESFWSLIRRGIMGSYHHVSRAYLPLYLNEFAFRFNNRKNPRMFETMLQTVER